MLRAFSPGNDIYSFRNNYSKKSQLTSKAHSINTIFPNIKQTKDQIISTEEIKSSSDNNKNNNLNIDENFLPKNIIKNKFIFNGINKSKKIQFKDSLINNIIYNINNKQSTLYVNKNSKNNKLFFNRNYKLKSIEKAVIKSNSSTNIINKHQTLTVINIPSNNLEKNILNDLINQNKSLKRSSSLPKINFNIDNKNEIKNNNISIKDNNCNFLYMRYSGIDNSKLNNLKKKKYMVINSHKVIESLKSLSMPDDNYGKKLIDILESRINSGYYRKVKFNFGKNYQVSRNYQNLWDPHETYLNEKKRNENNKSEKKKFSNTFLTDVYDDFLLPNKDNKYNYTIHKIFLNNIIGQICKKMVEIRDVKNRLITKQEIRDEFCNQLNYLRDALYNNHHYNVINNNIFNINNNTNIINIDLSNNNSLINEISTIEELQENSFNINTTNADKDKDKQYLTSNMLKLVNNNQLSPDHFNSNYLYIENYSNTNLDNMQTKYKNVSKNENQKLLDLIKDNLKIKNNNLSLHDTCSNIYLNKVSKGTNTKKSQIKNFKNIIRKKLYEKKYITALTETYYSEEKKLNNVDKFLLNTKKLRYTFNSYNKESKEERNYSYDLEGNIQHSFKTKQKINIVNFEDIFDDIQQQYDKNNNTDNAFSKIEIIKEIMRYYYNNKHNIHSLKFNNEIIQKYLSLIIPYKSLKINHKKNKIKNKNKKNKKKKNILEDISKKIHKKIKIKGGKVMNTEYKETKLKQHHNTEENFKEKRNYYVLTDISSSKQTKINEHLYTDNIYLEIETNSSEYTDVPSELDSEIEEMIRKKKEREKDKEAEEGVYAQDKEEKRRGGDYIIVNPKDKDKEKEIKKQKEKERLNKLKQKNEIDNNNNNKANEQTNNENNTVKDENTNTILPDKDIQNFSNVYLNSNIEKYLNTNENKNIEKSKSFKGNKTLFRANTLHLTKSSTATNTTSGSKGIVDMKLNIDNSKKINRQGIFRKNSLSMNSLKDTNDKFLSDDKKKNKNIDIKNLADLHLRKSTILENIIEEESKETKRPRQNKEKSTKRKKTRKKTKKKKSTIRKDIKINTDNSSVNNKNPSSATSDYEAYSLNNDITLDNKSTNMPISSKYHNNDIKDTNINNINSESKENLNKEKNEISDSDEDEDEEINMEKNNSFCIQRPKLSIGDDDEDENEEQQFSQTISYFDSFINKLNKIMSLKKNKKEEKEEEEEIENSQENEFEEEEDYEGKRKRFKREKKDINIKGVKGLFMDENNGEIGMKDENNVSEKIEEIPKKMGWEEKFELFKQYVQELKDMNDEQFNYDSMKYLKEKDKEDFSGKAKLSQVERINTYKSFLMQAKSKRLNYNNYYTSHVIFTPGCIFNTGELLK